MPRLSGAWFSDREEKDMSVMQIPEGLRAIRNIYADAGYELWLVGGCVRDHIAGNSAKDIDLATSATPEEQIRLCNEAELSWHATGLQHGTLTVLCGNEPYEITTFRTDVETDGRHAVVEYTRDLIIDLARRDLTINAIAMSFNGEIVDPFSGQDDIKEGRVRFVGEASDRIREDYLRIMRWFRFLGRYGSDLDRDTSDAIAVRANAEGLKQISVERIWSEMQRILAGPRPAGILEMMNDLDVLEALDLPAGNLDAVAEARRYTDDPALLLAAWLNEDAPATIGKWKASNSERAAVAFIVNRMKTDYSLEAAKLDMVNEVNLQWVDFVLRLQGNNAAIRELSFWEVLAFPIAGRDLFDAGMSQGREMGEKLKEMRALWIRSDYKMSKAELLDNLVNKV